MPQPLNSKSYFRYHLSEHLQRNSKHNTASYVLVDVVHTEVILNWSQETTAANARSYESWFALIQGWNSVLPALSWASPLSVGYWNQQQGNQILHFNHNYAVVTLVCANCPSSKEQLRHHRRIVSHIFHTIIVFFLAYTGTQL